MVINLGKYEIIFWSFIIVLPVIMAKILIHYYSLEFLSVNPLFTSTMAGVIFIIGILLAGTMSDYKEAEKIPSELRAGIENILDEARMFHLVNKDFSLCKVEIKIKEIISKFLAGLSKEEEHSNLEPCLSSIDELSQSFFEMDRLGIAANYLVRLKTEQGNLRKMVLRVYHIQKTKFIPSVYILATSLIFFIIFFLLFLKTEGSPESLLLMGFISYLLLYIIKLICVIETPFRKGHKSMDDVSLFLLGNLIKKHNKFL